MSVTRETAAKIASLARIRMDEPALDRMVPELNAILDWVEQLGEVDVEGVEPMTSVVAQTLKMREDKVTAGGDAAAIIANAPVSEDNFFVVPKVVE